jgi:K+-transporting ATPase ATPase C chain
MTTTARPKMVPPGAAPTPAKAPDSVASPRAASAGQVSAGADVRSMLLLFVLLTLLTGAIYPALVTGVARVLFPSQAEGSVIMVDGQAVGSSLIGQTTSSPRYFHGRPSATGRVPCDSTASAASNLGPTNPALADAVAARIAALRAEDPGNAAPIPVDLVTASGSGLDPHISPAAAEWQVARVARVRGLDEARVRQLVAGSTEGRTFALLGESRVNVLQLNLALDAASR